MFAREESSFAHVLILPTQCPARPLTQVARSPLRTLYDITLGPEVIENAVSPQKLINRLERQGG